MKSVDIVAMGYIFNENIQWPDGRMQGPFLGATVSYGAVALGNLGANAGLVSNIGKDTPQSLLRPLYDCGIDLEGLHFKEGASEVKNLLVYHEDGTKEIKYLTRSPEIAFEDIPESYLNAKVFHLCLVDYDVPAKTLEAIKKVNPQAIFSADLGGAGGAHSTPELRAKYLRADGGRRQADYLRRIDIGKASLEDAQLVFGREFQTPVDAAAAYIEAGVGMMVVTMGEEGAYILDNSGAETIVPAATPYNGVVDTTGAGDTFITAFVAEHLRTGDVKQAAYFASATSSLLIEKTGGVQTSRTPTREQVRQRLEKFLRN